jgi:hypothetical protein
MGKSIGSLGRKREPLDMDFDYFGETIRIHPYATDEVELDFIDAGRDIDVDSLTDLDFAEFESKSEAEQTRILATLGKAQRAGYLAIMNALRKLIHPDDFETYRRLGAEHGQQVRDRMSDIRAITVAVVEATTDFPTGQRSGSPDGPPTTPPSSEVASFSQTRAGSDFETALALERGRPDLQEFFVIQREAEEQAAREEAERTTRDQQRLTDAGLH